MEHYPKMDISFPPAREAELHKEMERLAHTPWSPQPYNPHGKPADGDHFYFHRDVVGDEPSCTVCIWRKEPGHWIVTTLVPDEGQVTPIPIDQYKKILTNFESDIAEAAAGSVEGITSIDMSLYRLEDYFSREAVKLLQHFCDTSNQSDLGQHLDDQEKWIAFLLQVYDDNNDVHCDIFGRCLQTAGWWPEEGIPILVSEYDFAMRLLEQSGR
ncbi:MAG: hypothetical protein ACYTEL_04290 [Planctomycetota bacterium]|jgi:hypothetical protein